MTTIQRRAIAPPGQGTFFREPQPANDLEEDERYYVTKSNTSARRYANAPVKQGKPRYNVVAGPPPAAGAPQVKRRRMHWLTWVGIAMFVMILGWAGLTALGNWWRGVQDNFDYGMPRTYQTDANVGHNGRVSHFIALNLGGDVEIIETQRGHPEASKIYTVTVLPEDQAYVPVTLTFHDITGNGRIDALVHVGDTVIPMYNNGTGFQSQPPGH